MKRWACLWLVLLVFASGCRSDEEEEYITKCTDVCKKEHAAGCGSGVGADGCEDECEEKCDDVFGDCFQQEIRALECRLTAADICVPSCLDEDGDVVACSLVDAIVPFSAP